MWLASGDSIVTANLWWFLGSVSIALISAAVTIYTLRSRPRDSAAPTKREIAKAVDDALKTQSVMIIDPLRVERDDYRTRWQRCVENCLRWKRDD